MSVLISHIDDVLPHLTEGIRVNAKGDYTVIDYGYCTPATFSNSMALECRGLKFDTDGKLIARPFQKFFNVGEREAPEDIGWSAPHWVYEKLDGSMIHGCILGGKLTFMTRGGVTSQSTMAFNRASEGVKALADHYGRIGKTAIFEFTSPDNRVVVSYEDDAVTLLAVRDNFSGIYESHAEITDAAARFKVSLVQHFDPVGDHEKFIADARALAGVEGYVIAFDCGHRLKIKCDEYAFRHKALGTIANERTVFRIVLEGREDDITPNLSPEISSRLKVFSADVNQRIDILSAMVIEFVDEHRGLDRKSFADSAKADLSPLLLPVAFGTLDGKDTRELVVSSLTRASGTLQKLQELRKSFSVEWSLDDIPIHEIAA